MTKWLLISYHLTTRCIYWANNNIIMDWRESPRVLRVEFVRGDGNGACVRVQCVGCRDVSALLLTFIGISTAKRTFFVLNLLLLCIISLDRLKLIF